MGFQSICDQMPKFHLFLTRERQKLVLNDRKWHPSLRIIKLFESDFKNQIPATLPPIPPVQPTTAADVLAATSTATSLTTPTTVSAADHHNVTFPTSTTPVPFEQRGSELTFEETGMERTFMFAQNNTFIQMDGDIIQTFQLRLCREISFQFRTKLPHGLLVYHNVKNPQKINLDLYALYVIVEKGQLKVVHVFGKHSTSV